MRYVQVVLSNSVQISLKFKISNFACYYNYNITKRIFCEIMNETVGELTIKIRFLKLRLLHTQVERDVPNDGANLF